MACNMVRHDPNGLKQVCTTHPIFCSGRGRGRGRGVAIAKVTYFSPASSSQPFCLLLLIPDGRERPQQSRRAKGMSLPARAAAAAVGDTSPSGTGTNLLRPVEGALGPSCCYPLPVTKLEVQRTGSSWWSSSKVGLLQVLARAEKLFVRMRILRSARGRRVLCRSC